MCQLPQNHENKTTPLLCSLAGAIAIVPTALSAAETVTAKNHVRAETDYQLKTYVASMDNFGKFVHSREPYDVKNQVTVRGNRDTLYSFGVFDLASPLWKQSKIELPK